MSLFVSKEGSLLLKVRCFSDQNFLAFFWQKKKKLGSAGFVSLRESDVTKVYLAGGTTCAFFLFRFVFFIIDSKLYFQEIWDFFSLH